MSKRIEKKAWPDMFEKVFRGDKDFDVRLADFDINSGDTLVLREWDPKTKNYTGRQIEKKVEFVFKTKDAKYWSKEDVEKYGFQIISFD